MPRNKHNNKHKNKHKNKHNTMKKAILTMLGTCAVCYTCAGDVSAFKVEGITETKDIGKQQIVRMLELRHIRHISGETRESFNLTVKKSIEVPFGFSRVTRDGPWFSVHAGETVVVFYKNGIENPSKILVGMEYVDDVEFYLSVPGNLDLIARQQKLDQYLRTHPKLRFDRLIGMIAQVVIDSGYNKDLWMKYVGGNPIKMENTTYSEFFESLSDMLDDIQDEDGKGTLPEEVRKPRINLWISEFATQLGGATYSEASAREGGVRLLAKRYKKFREFVTDETQARIERLLASDMISDKDRKLFQ
jgi:hypothetical protein